MKNTFILLLSLFPFWLNAQSNIQQSVSVNSTGAAPDASAQLDVSSTDKGMLVPRMTTAQRTTIASPATGLLVFDTDTGGFWFYNGTAWTDLSGGGGTPSLISDADGDTKVQVEENPDEDIIRFDIGGTEKMVLRKNTAGSARLELPHALENTFVGEGAGQANTTGYYNTVNGTLTLYSNTTGSYNTAIGRGALYSNTTGSYNTANGAIALYSNTTGLANTVNGHAALYYNTTGYNNTAIGAFAMDFNNTGSNNTAIGYAANVHSGDLINATALGSYAKVGCSDCMALGGTGADAVRIGVGIATPNASALLDLTSTNKGLLAPRMTTAQRTAIGSPAEGLLVFDTTTDSFWFFSGSAWTNLSSPKIMADADNNTKIQVEESANENIIRFDLGGTEKMKLLKNASNHVRLDLTAVNGNTLIGSNAGNSLTTGINNTALGFEALDANVGGNWNTALGYRSLTANTTGYDNTATGMEALNANIGGFRNTANGAGSMLLNTTGDNNTAIGFQSLRGNQTGNRNTVIGSNAGLNTTGSGNVFIGFDAGKNITDDDKLFIDNSSTATPLIWGNFADNRIGINRVATDNTLEVGGNASKSSPGEWLGNSDARLKKNIQPLDSRATLQKLLALQGVTYEWNDDKTGTSRPEGVQYGFTAQNILSVFPELVTEDAQGYLQTAYGTYDAMYVEALRALAQENEAQKAENERLKNELATLRQAQQQTADRLQAIEAKLSGETVKR